MNKLYLLYWLLLPGLNAGFGQLPTEIKFLSSRFFPDSVCVTDSIDPINIPLTYPDTHTVYFVRVLGDTSTAFLKVRIGHNWGDTVVVPVPQESLKLGEALQYGILPHGDGRDLLCPGVPWTIVLPRWKPSIPIEIIKSIPLIQDELKK